MGSHPSGLSGKIEALVPRFHTYLQIQLSASTFFRTKTAIFPT